MVEAFQDYTTSSRLGDFCRLFNLSSACPSGGIRDPNLIGLTML